MLSPRPLANLVAPTAGLSDNLVAPTVGLSAKLVSPTAGLSADLVAPTGVAKLQAYRLDDMASIAKSWQCRGYILLPSLIYSQPVPPKALPY